MAEFKLLSKTEIMKQIKGLGAEVKRLDDKIKDIALQCLAHAKAHGDVTLMDALIDELPKGYFNNGFRQWMNNNSPIRIDPKTGKIRQMKPGEPGFKPYNVEAAAETPMVKRETGANAAERLFGLDTAIKLITGLPKRVETAEKNGSLIVSDRKKIMTLHEAVIGVVNKLDLKPSRIHQVEDERVATETKKARKGKLIARNRKPRTDRTPVSAASEPANRLVA